MEDGDYSIGGVKGTASQIKVTFVEPAGSMTNKLFPSGSRQEYLTIHSDLGDITVKVSMIDAANPFVFVDAASMPQMWHSLDRNDPTALELVEQIRCAAAVKMGLATDTSSARLVRGTPKIAALLPPKNHNNSDVDKMPVDVQVISYSMGKMHPSFQLTGAVCLGAAVSIPGTVASDIANRSMLNTPPRSPSRHDVTLGEQRKIEQNVVIAHPSGKIEAEVCLTEAFDGGVSVEGVTVSRTARRLFEGNVLIPSRH